MPLESHAVTLASHPLPSAEDASEPNSEEERSEHHEEGIDIKVTQSPGYLCHIQATATFRVPPDTLFRQIITHPGNEQVFRHMDRCSYRRILEDSGNGRQKVEVEHEASWRFLIFHGKFTTRLLVDQDIGERVMRFTLKPGSKGIMRKFVGEWRIEPHPTDPNACITYLDQDLALGIYMPPPFDRILKGISCSACRRIMDDVRMEVQWINRGKPTLPPWEEVQLTEIGVTDEREAVREPSLVVQQAEAPAGMMDQHPFEAGAHTTLTPA